MRRPRRGDGRTSPPRAASRHARRHYRPAARSSLTVDRRGPPEARKARWPEALPRRPARRRSGPKQPPQQPSRRRNEAENRKARARGRRRTPQMSPGRWPGWRAERRRTFGNDACTCYRLRPPRRATPSFEGGRKKRRLSRGRKEYGRRSIG